MGKRKIYLALGLILVGILTSAFLNTYYIMDRANGDLLWRDGDRAYVFIHVGSLGYRLSYLKYFGSLLVGLFGIAPEATAKNTSVFILEITEEGVQPHEVKNLSLDVFTPMGENVYSASGGVVYKWGGAQFQRASEEESRSFRMNSVSAPDFTDIDGWSKRCCVLARATTSTFNLPINGRLVTLAVTQSDKDNDVSISITRDSQVPERIWYLNQRSRKVNKVEYEEVFGAN